VNDNFGLISTERSPLSSIRHQRKSNAWLAADFCHSTERGISIASVMKRSSAP